MGTDYERLLTTANAGKSPREVLTEPITALLGVGQAAAAALQKLNIETVFDLAASGTFRIAAAVAAAAVQDGQTADGWFGRLDRLPRDAVDAGNAGVLLEDAAKKPTDVLRAISVNTGQELGTALAVTTIRDLGLWPPYHAAKSILAEAYGFAAESEAEDAATPQDLVPATGRYPTERVQYQVVVLDQILAGAHVMNPRVSLLDAGPIDVSNSNVEGFSSPALGAVLTYTQSWFTQGLTLGQLLHTVALAPGESTRIAMIDWSRRTGARIGEDITQTEFLNADLTRTRALSEVVHAVAKESQSGFSVGGGTGASTTTGSAGGGAVDLTETGIPVSLTGGVSRGLGMGGSVAASYATSSGRRDIDAWVSQNITDSTHQNASSTRNRWATVVREVSQQESESVSTRALTNFNHMHALSVEYYEVVQLYRTIVELARADRCLFIPMKLIKFRGTDAALRYRPMIAAAGLLPEVRATAYADPDTLLFTAPNRSGPWYSGTLASIEKATGYKPAPTESSLPLDVRLTLSAIAIEGQNALVVTDVFDTVTVGERSGAIRDLLIKKSGDGAVVGPYSVSLGYNHVGSATPPYVTDLQSIILHKKGGKEDWEGEVNISFRGDWQIPGLTKEEDYIFSLRFPVNAKKGVADITLSNITLTLGRDDLIRHLEENTLHYSQAIWRNLDGATLGHILDHYTIKLTGGAETSLALVLDPIPIGASGNYLMFRLPSDPLDDAWARFLKNKGLVIGSRREDLVPLPSGGVFAEAVLGRFNAAEKIDLSRFWNWQDSPIPITAPEISAIQTGSRAQQEPGEPGQLGAPVVNIQNAPSLPDPQGLTAVLQALANGAMFRDMSGLEGTQQLARAFLEETMRGATASAAQAGQNMQTAADFASRMAALRGSSQQNRWGSSNTPNSLTGEGGRLNYGRDLDQRSDGANGTAEREQFDAGTGTAEPGVGGSGDAGTGGSGDAGTGGSGDAGTGSGGGGTAVIAVAASPAHPDVNQNVTFALTGAPVGSTIGWSGGGVPASGSGTSFTTRFPTHGPHVVTATWSADAGSGSASGSVNVRERSGAQWAPRFPKSKDLAILALPFRDNLNNFLAALATAKAHVDIDTTYRPPERAYLMYWAWRISHGHDPASVPSLAGVEIAWLHRRPDGTPDVAASKAAAAAMVAAYGMAYPATLSSRHEESRAVDMTIKWTGTLTIVDGTGATVTIATTPRHGGLKPDPGNVALHAVGATYGVHKLLPDYPHWSDDGH